MQHIFSSHLRAAGIVSSLTLSLAVSACSSPPKTKPVEVATSPISTSSNPNIILGTADIESIQASISSTTPMRGRVVVNGLLSDGATSIHEIQQTRITGGFVITITTARDRNAMATLALVPFEREITLDLSANASGPCEVRVNGKSTILNIP